MTERQRILAVLNGETPDRVPFMLDLSHFYYEKFQKEWNLLNGYEKPEYELIDYHKKFKAGFYLPNQSLQFAVKHSDNVKTTVETVTINGNPEIHWKYETPLGEIERIRIWEKSSYSWAIKKWGVTTEQDLKILGFAMANRTFEPLVQNYIAWDEYIGDIGIAYLLPGYSTMGHILNYWMGIEKTIYACEDWNSLMHEVVDQINDNCLKIVRLLAEYPAPAVLMGDNFSSDVQPQSFFNEWSASFYKEAIDIFHRKGKKVAVHIDGKLRGAINMIGRCGADIIDAVTPAPMGDLTPAQCREEAGPHLILSGGVPPNLWLTSTPIEIFKKSVMDWLNLKHSSSALIANAGDQVPPQADENRISVMRELVEKYGQYS